MSTSAFGVEVGKHYLGGHGEDDPHERTEHGDLRRARRATKRAYKSARQGAASDAYHAQREEHPLRHAVETRMGQGSSWPTSADRAGIKAGKDWTESSAGKRAGNARDHAKGDWNPRYGKHRQADIKARRQMGTPVAKSAFGIEHDNARQVAYEIEKFEVPGMAKLTGMGADALKGLKIGAKGKGIGGGPSSTVGQLGAKVGTMGRNTAQYGRRNLKPLGIGAGAGAVGGFGIHRNSN